MYTVLQYVQRYNKTTSPIVYEAEHIPDSRFPKPPPNQFPSVQKNRPVNRWNRPVCWSKKKCRHGLWVGTGPVRVPSRTRSTENQPNRSGSQRFGEPCLTGCERSLLRVHILLRAAHSGASFRYHDIVLPSRTACMRGTPITPSLKWTLQRLPLNTQNIIHPIYEQFVYAKGSLV
jgi:hypothetical protein